jgi:hypothetical protein
LLRSELFELEKSVGAIITEKSTAKPSSYQQQIADRVASVRISCSDLKKKWTHELLSNAKEQVIKRYVQYHQAGIIQLADEISRQVPASNVPDAIKALQIETYGQLNEELENILEFLRRQFYQYFDIDHKASMYHCLLLELKIAEFTLELTNYNNAAVKKSLVACILASVDEIAAEGSIGGISYRQADQCLNLVRMTYQLLQSGTATTTESLVRALYQQNMNSLHFYNWYQEHILEEITTIGDKPQRQALIGDQIRSFSGIFVLPEKALQPELPPTAVFIISWLQEQAGGEGKRTRFTSPAFQFPLNLSVPQFALFVRIFYKTGCFPVENVAMITRFFTAHFTTKKQSHISQKSFGRAFYNLDQSAAAVVRDILQKLLNYLNKTYFP